jgi:DNA replication protein DnaC
VTSQLPKDRLHDYLSGGNPTVGDAIMDRLTGAAHTISIKGESIRKLNKKQKSN